MLGAITRKIFGSANDRMVKSLSKTVDRISRLEPELSALTDEKLQARTAEFKARLDAGAKLDDLLVEAFAVVREAARRTVNMRPFDVQLVGGMVLHQGKIAEMKTGEGKTLVATMPVYLNALSGQGVHVVTVNDYLAQRDADWMGEVYRFLGLSVGVIKSGVEDAQRREAYACDITYGTNNEIGFDYLRDNMKSRVVDMVQRPYNFAIVDEVDSILIDEARTPLIISGPARDSSEDYSRVDSLIPSLVEDHYEIDEKQRSVTLTESGQEHVEDILRQRGILVEGNLYDVRNAGTVHHVQQALRAHKLYQKDRDYIVKDDKVIIIDEFTGRMMEGRRFSDGLHQALEAKEAAQIQRESQTLASITFQNLFRTFPKLAGMTGTAATEAGEFAEIYGLEVVEIPTHMDVARSDDHDEVYRSTVEKNRAIVALITECHGRDQPVLVGTVSIEKSEQLSRILKKENVPHAVLNARFHEQEAMIIAQAGRPGGVTIATNMAGRGTDIKLGGNLDMRLSQEVSGIEEDAEREAAAARIEAECQGEHEAVIAAGGLFVIGTERHESRRIDNQLRGRSGRQGDPGQSKFFLSLEDDLMRIFASDRLDGMLQKLGLKDDEAIVHPWINKALERAQSKVEARNFEIRKNLLKFDNVMNDQRRVIYDQRRDIMGADSVQEIVTDMRHEVVHNMVAKSIPQGSYAEQWDAATLTEDARRDLGLELPVAEWAREEGIAETELEDRIRDASDRHLAERAANLGPESFRQAEKQLLLQILDQIWKEHLLMLDHLRQGIGLRAYAQRDPLREYQTEAFTLFEELLERLRQTVTRALSVMELRVVTPEEMLAQQQARMRALVQARQSRQDPAQIQPEATSGTGAPMPTAGPTRVGKLDANDPATWGKVPRNAPCPCQSGKKYKHCHGRLTQTA